jgi:hypothetical protein
MNCIRCYVPVLAFALLAPGLNVTPAYADRIFLKQLSVTPPANSPGSASRSRTDVQVLVNNAYLSWEDGGNANGVGGVEIYDVSNPLSPTLLGSCEGRAAANALRVTGGYAYLAAGTLRNFTNDPGWLEIFDVSDAAHPVRVGGIETPGRALALQVAGNIAYVAESVRWTGTNLMGALEILDVSNPAHPIRLSTYNTGAAATSVDIHNDHAYLADGLTDLEVLDVSNPSAPRRVGGYDTDEWRNYGAFEHGGAAVHIQVVDGLVYSAGGDGLYILDVTNPAMPVPIGAPGWHALPLDYPFNVSGGYASFSFWHSSRNAFWLHLSDVSDPVALAGLGSTELPYGPNSIQAVGRSIYIAAGPLLIYEICEEPAFRSIWSNGEIISLFWNAPAGFRLQCSPSLVNPDWKDVPDVGDKTWVDLPVDNASKFFRLRKP